MTTISAMPGPAALLTSPLALPGLGIGLRCCVQAARPNLSAAHCSRLASALRADGVRSRRDFAAKTAWVEYLEREITHLEERTPLRPRAAVADDAQLRSWQERWRKHRELQRPAGPR